VQPGASLLFRSRGEFGEAVLTALASCGHELALLDRDFADWPLDSPAGSTALEALLAGGTGAPRLRLLVSDPDWLERRAPRWMRLRLRYREAIGCRRLAPGHAVTEGLLIGDRRHLLRRAHADRFRGRLSLASPAAAEPALRRFDALWDEAIPCLPATTLGL
jgi:hypothetical protein